MAKTLRAFWLVLERSDLAVRIVLNDLRACITGCAKQQFPLKKTGCHIIKYFLTSKVWSKREIISFGLDLEPQFKNSRTDLMTHTKLKLLHLRNGPMLGVRLSSYGCTREVERAREKRLSGTRLKHGPFILEHCHFKRKLIKYKILLNHSERFDWLNAITRSDRRTGVRLSRFRRTLTPYKKRAKYCQLCSNVT